MENQEILEKIANILKMNIDELKEKTFIPKNIYGLGSQWLPILIIGNEEIITDLEKKLSIKSLTQFGTFETVNHSKDEVVQDILKTINLGNHYVFFERRDIGIDERLLNPNEIENAIKDVQFGYKKLFGFMTIYESLEIDLDDSKNLYIQKDHFLTNLIIESKKYSIGIRALPIKYGRIFNRIIIIQVLKKNFI